MPSTDPTAPETTDPTVVSELTNESRGRGTAGTEPPPSDLNTTDETVKTSSSATSTWLAEKGIDSRYIIRNADTHKPTLRPVVNFNEIRKRIEVICVASYREWDKLRNNLLGRVNDVTTYIDEGCDQLAIASVYILYSHLRFVAGKHDFANADIYSRRCTFDYRTQLPKGIIHLVQQFGMCLLEEVWKNPRVIHTWDKKDDKTYGLPNTVHFDSEKFDSFMTALTGVGVELDKLPSTVPPRTAWDSLYVIASDPHSNDASGITSDYNIFTTFPDKNYNLPRDIFLVLGLIGETVITDSDIVPVQFYGPRAQPVEESDLFKILNTEEGISTSTMNTRKRRKSLTKSAKIDPNKTTPCTPFEHMTLSGIEIPKRDAKNARAWIYGRGTQDDVIIIRSVGRGVDLNEVTNFYKTLLRNGP